VTPLDWNGNPLARRAQVRLQRMLPCSDIDRPAALAAQFIEFIDHRRERRFGGLKINH
jgi:hypothetical protein